jgi:hypothetical protein
VQFGGVRKTFCITSFIVLICYFSYILYQQYLFSTEKGFLVKHIDNIGEFHIDFWLLYLMTIFFLLMTSLKVFYIETVTYEHVRM